MRPADARKIKLLADWQLLGLCIEREASGEPREGKIAVATVVLERVDHRKWDGNTIQEVILKPWQFSWTMPECGEAYYEEAVYIAENWVDAYAHDETLQECSEIALGMLQGTIPRDPDLAAEHCCQYCTPAATKTAKWDDKMTAIKTIGGHVFFI